MTSLEAYRPANAKQLPGVVYPLLDYAMGVDGKAWSKV